MALLVWNYSAISSLGSNGLDRSTYDGISGKIHDHHDSIRMNHT
jgi:hypothetical protein